MNDFPDPDFSDFGVTATLPAPKPDFVARFFRAVQNHPIKVFGLIETIFWLGVLYTLVDVLIHPNGQIAWFVWALTIGPHEIGHILCIPFGQLLYIAGGSIWQVLFWALLGVYTLLRSRQITVTLLFWAIAGHSFINLAVYIGDARARQLKLLFGMDASHHDWYNLLNMLKLLPYDHTFAVIAGGLGILLILASVTAGLLTAWMVPRLGIQRYRFRKLI
jgi:hypothetical protein